MEYPMCVYDDGILRDEMVEQITKLSDLTEAGNWAEALPLLQEHCYLINYCRLPKKNTKAALYNPLHEAARTMASKEVFEKLLEFRVCKSLKTVDGQTAYDIAKEKGLSDDILKLIELPAEIVEHAEEIQRMEKTLHKLIMKRVEHNVKEYGMALPQLVWLFEIGNFFYDVPFFYGGFNVEKHKKGIQATSFSRIVGGSGKVHVIKRNGKIKKIESGLF
ncbi:hypothetical protein ACF0H5_004071 [Mactra antiquata]